MLAATDELAELLAARLREHGFAAHVPGSEEYPAVIATHADLGFLVAEVSASSDPTLSLNQRLARLRNDVPELERTPAQRLIVDLPDARPTPTGIAAATLGSEDLLTRIRPRALEPGARAALDAFFAPRLTIEVPRRDPVVDSEAEARDKHRIELDREQSSIATTDAPDVLLLTGPAGSGKSLVLAARAKWMARQHPEWRIVLLCYNRLLVPYLERLVWGHANIDVHTFSDFAKRLKVKVDLSNESWAEKHVARALSEVQPKYDAILIDEWQDFMDPWTRLAFGVLRKGRGGMTLAGDPKQALYRESDPRSLMAHDIVVAELKRPYRSTRQVLDVTSALRGDLQVLGRDLAPEGLPVDLVWATNVQECARAIAHDIRQAVDSGTHSVADIGVLVTRRDDISYARYALQSEGVPVSAIYSTPEATIDLSEQTVKVITVHSAKGYEFGLVYVLGMDKIADDDDSDRSRHEGRTGYVGFTRAKDRLMLTYSRENVYLDRVRSLSEDLVKQWVWPDDFPEAN